MARKSRAAPATIAGLKKLEVRMNAKQNAYYAAHAKYSEYKDRVEDLGAGYSENVDGVVHVIALTPSGYRNEKVLTIIECKPPR